MFHMGLFEADMSSDAFQLLGMRELRMLSAIFAVRSKYRTPTFGILCSATRIIFLSSISTPLEATVAGQAVTSGGDEFMFRSRVFLSYVICRKNDDNDEMNFYNLSKKFITL
ncbi:hypothetical protein Dimus_021602 [Dionaea muscipula]